MVPLTSSLLFIPVTLEAAALLAALTHPNHLVRLSSWAEFLCRLAATPMALGIVIYKFNAHTIKTNKSCRQLNNPNEKYDFQTLPWLYSGKKLYMTLAMKFKTVGLIGKQAHQGANLSLKALIGVFD